MLARKSSEEVIGARYGRRTPPLTHSGANESRLFQARQEGVGPCSARTNRDAFAEFSDVGKCIGSRRRTDSVRKSGVCPCHIELGAFGFHVRDRADDETGCRYRYSAGSPCIFWSNTAASKRSVLSASVVLDNPVRTSRRFSSGKRCVEKPVREGFAAAGFVTRARLNPPAL